MYRKILVPVDGSPASDKALLLALRVAGLKGGRVRLVHVPEPPAWLTGDAEGGPLLRTLDQQGREILRRALAVADAAEVDAEVRLLEASGRRLGDVIAEDARTWPADLIVIGTHGRRGVQRVVLGSGAEQILRLAPVPVLTVRGGA